MSTRTANEAKDRAARPSILHGARRRAEVTAPNRRRATPVRPITSGRRPAQATFRPGVGGGSDGAASGAAQFPSGHFFLQRREDGPLFAPGGVSRRGG